MIDRGRRYETQGTLLRSRQTSDEAQSDGAVGFTLPRPPWSQLKVVWQEGRPSATEIGALRELFPTYANVPLTALSQLPDSSFLDVHCREREARHLQAAAAQRGLRLDVEVELCHVCSCDLTGITTGVCPECGTEVR